MYQETTCKCFMQVPKVSSQSYKQRLKNKIVCKTTQHLLLCAFMCTKYIHEHINPFSSTFLGTSSMGSNHGTLIRSSDLPLPCHFLHLIPGNRYSQTRWEILSLQHVLGSTPGPSLHRIYPEHTESILIKCMNHINWLLSMWRSSGFSLNLS